MRNIVAGLLVAALLIAAGSVSLAESRHSRRLADAHERLATLQYTDKGDRCREKIRLADPPHAQQCRDIHQPRHRCEHYGSKHCLRQVLERARQE